MTPDFDTAYRAMTTRDPRFDGQFVTAVKTTGIYCRPACPSRTPARQNVTFYAAAAAAQAAGYRACKRCLPDAAPGSPDWNRRTDTVGAAMRLIGDGVVDRDGVTGLARTLGYSARHLNRLLTEEIGASPLALARAKRADTARILLTHTGMSASDIAFAAGFSSVRQFNDTIREVYATTPSALRSAGSGERSPHGKVTLRLPVRRPFCGSALLDFLGARAIPGVEMVSAASYARTVRLPHGLATAVLTMPPDDDSPAATTDSGMPGTATVIAQLSLESTLDLAPAVERCRRLLDADADPVGIGSVLRTDAALAAALDATPGLRLPGSITGDEILFRALIGQQVSVAAARTKLARLTAAVGTRLPDGMTSARTDGSEPAPDHDATATLAQRLTHVFPTAAQIAELTPADIAGPRRRAATIIHAARDMAAGTLRVDPGRTTADLTAELVARSGIGPWTAGYVAMRVLGDPDVLLTGDLGLRHGAAALGLPDDAKALARCGERWAPFRSYAGMYLWQAAALSADRRIPNKATHDPNRRTREKV